MYDGDDNYNKSTFVDEINSSTLNSLKFTRTDSYLKTAGDHKGYKNNGDISLYINNVNRRRRQYLVKQQNTTVEGSLQYNKNSSLTLMDNNRLTVVRHYNLAPQQKNFTFFDQSDFSTKNLLMIHLYATQTDVKLV